ncbi:relaxase/mobilization nuclease domain-containing protein [[Clostridium] innocuum]|nr:relaxase/mobilization nuclease domain-containing protein [[Clostridium] innocuum]
MSNLVVCSNEYEDNYCVSDVLQYIIRPKSPTDYVDWHGLGVLESSILHASDSFHAIKSIYEKENGKQLHHFILNLDASSPLIYSWLHIVGFKTLQFIFDKGYQCVMAFHTNTYTPHIHIVINSINFKNGKRLDQVQSFYNQVLYYLKYEFSALRWESSVIYK